MSQKRLLRIAAWSCLCFIACATLSPLRDRPNLLIRPSVEHFASFALFGTLFCLAYPRRIPAVLILVLGSAVLLELLQLLTLDRHARILDAIEKIVGSVSGVFAGRAILHFERVRAWLQVDLGTVAGERGRPCESESVSTRV